MKPTEPLDEFRPYFIDNRGGATLDRALRAYIRKLREQEQLVFSLDIATGFFNVPGFDLLAEEFCRTAKMRLLLGAEPRPEAERIVRQPGDPPEPDFESAPQAAFVSRSREQIHEPASTPGYRRERNGYPSESRGN